MNYERCKRLGRYCKIRLYSSKWISIKHFPFIFQIRNVLQYTRLLCVCVCVRVLRVFIFIYFKFKYKSWDDVIGRAEQHFLIALDELGWFYFFKLMYLYRISFTAHENVWTTNKVHEPWNNTSSRNTSWCFVPKMNE